MRYIGWLGCLSFGLVALYQHSVIVSMEDSYMISAKFNEPITIQEGNELIRIKSTGTKKQTIKSKCGCIGAKRVDDPK
jgi:hypothetical protein